MSSATPGSNTVNNACGARPKLDMVDPGRNASKVAATVRPSLRTKRNDCRSTGSCGTPCVVIGTNEVKHRGGAPLSWSLIGGTDLDGDGKGDLVWLSPANVIRSLTSKADRTWVNERVGDLLVGYSILKLGDLNGDARGDMLFRNAQGNVKAWLMNGISIEQDVALPVTDATWSYYAAGDFNGDGTLDIVWKKDDGTLVLWWMNKGNISQPTIIDNAGIAPAGMSVEP